SVLCAQRSLEHLEPRRHATPCTDCAVRKLALAIGRVEECCQTVGLAGGAPCAARPPTAERLWGKLHRAHQCIACRLSPSGSRLSSLHPMPRGDRPCADTSRPPAARL